MSKTVEGIYRDGKVELLETPTDVTEARVVVTFLTEDAVDLQERGIGEAQAADLRALTDVRGGLGAPGDGSLRCPISAAMSS